MDFLDVFDILKIASRIPDSPAERQTFPNPTAGPVQEVGTLITLIDKPGTFREREREPGREKLRGVKEKYTH